MNIVDVVKSIHINKFAAFAYAMIAALLVSLVAVNGSVSAVATSDLAIKRCSTTSVVGHRGTVSGGVKENTLAAFKAAVAGGAKEIEFDIHRTKPEKGTGQWIIYHDKKIKGRTISKTKYSTLKKIEPSLTTYNQAMTYLKSVPNVRILVEIKPSKVSKGSLKYIAKVANKYNVRNRTVIQSFNKSILTKFKKYNKGFQLAFIMNKVKYSPKSIRKFANSVIINKSLIYSKKVSVTSMKSAGLKVYAYTANSATDWNKLAGYGVNAVITDYAKSYVSWCSAIQPKPVVKPPVKPPVTTPKPPVVPTPPTPPTPPVDTDPAEPEDTDPTETPVDPSTPID